MTAWPSRSAMGNRGAAALVVALLGAACGGGGEPKAVAPPAWAAGVCGHIVAWQDRTASLATTLETETQKLSDDLPAARRQASESVDEMVKATDQMIAGVDDTGTPDTPRGARIADRFHDGLEEAKGVLVEARAEADELSVENPATFDEGVEDIGEKLRTAGDRIGQARKAVEDDFEAPAIEAAFENEPQCQQVATPGDVPATSWTGAVCGSIVSWQNELQRLAGDLQTQIRAVGRNLTAARGRLVEFMTQVVASTDRLVAEMEAAGAPDTPQGEQVAEDFRQGVAQVRQAFEEGRIMAESLAVDDAAVFSAGADELSRKIREAGDRIRQEFRDLEQTYDVPELDKAFAEAPACRQARA